MPTDTTVPTPIGGVSGSNVNGGQGSTLVTRSVPAARVNPDTISTSKVGTTPGAPSKDGSNPTAAPTFADYESTKALTPEEASAISDRYTAQLQAQNDIINAQFVAKTTRQTDLNTGETARTRVLNARSGNIDSGTGAAAITTVQKKGSDALAALDDEKAAKVSQALGQIDQLKEAAIEKATSQKSEGVKAYNDTLAANKKTAMDSVKSLAEGEVSIDKLKADKAADGSSTYDKLLKASGLTPLEFDTQYNALHDDAHKIKYDYHVEGDTVFAYGTDPKTGKISVQSQKVPGVSATGDWSLFEAKDGRLFKQNKKTGDVLPLTASVPTTVDNTYTISPKTVNDLQGAGATKADVTAIQEGIRKAGSIDAYISSLTSSSTQDLLTKYLKPKDSAGGP